MMPVDTCLYIIDHDRTPSRHLRASHIHSIALDPGETLPILDPIAHELLLFGLQQSLGRFAYDHSALECLTGSRTPVLGEHSNLESANISAIPAGPQSIPGESGQPSVTHRRMCLLKQEHESRLQSQKNWEEALPVVKTFVVESPDRNSLMSGLDLFHLGYLRLHAPISKLHQLQYRLAEDWTIDPSLRSAILEWTTAPDARLATQRSCDLTP